HLPEPFDSPPRAAGSVSAAEPDRHSGHVWSLGGRDAILEGAGELISLPVATPDHNAADDGRDRAAAEPPPVKKRVLALRVRAIYVVRPVELGVEQGDVARRASRERPAVQAEHTRWSRGEKLHQPQQSDLSGVIKLLDR